MKIACLSSGGIDSTTMVYDLREKGYEIVAISFIYGQKALKEIKCAQKTARKLKIKHELINISGLKKVFLCSSLVNDTEDENLIDEKFTTIPNRNSIFLNILIAYALTNDITDIAYAAHYDDWESYPDCRPEFVKKIGKLAKIVSSGKINIITPFLNYKKSTIIKRGKELGVDFSNTWSCYSEQKRACGRCKSCIDRLEAFKQAEIRDPLNYE